MSFIKKGFNKQGIQQYSGQCRQCVAEYHEKYYVRDQESKIARHTPSAKRVYRRRRRTAVLSQARRGKHEYFGRSCKRGLPAIRPTILAYRRSGKHLQTIRHGMELFMKLAVLLICVSVVVLAIGFVEWVAKKVRNQDDYWGGHWPY